ncbi:MAG: allophanate hydrolase [Arachnia propionica]|nr:MAG: allophanate hydrolase [Arachnia propionica]
MIVSRYGDAALLVELPDLAEVLALDQTIRALRAAEVPAWRGVVEQIPAERTLMLCVHDAEQLPGLHAALLGLPPGRALATTAEHTVTITVRYDGADLAAVAAACGLSIPEVIAAHTGQAWRAGFAGFAPGFVYLIDGDPRLRVPRRAQPRREVPAGAVALAGSYSGVYPRSGPGGWQLIGTTDAVLFDVDRQPPSLLSPGCLVQFREAA